MVTSLSTYQSLVARGQHSWKDFNESRRRQLTKSNPAAVNERVSENIVIELLTNVLDWETECIQQQVEYADITLCHMGITRLIIETKRPGLLKWNKNEVEKALSQARRYADKQKVKTIAISDGHLLYAADIQHGGLKGRLYVELDSENFPDELFWLSKHGIYREREGNNTKLNEQDEISLAPDDILHPKYKIPARCFAYVGDATDHKTWKLPYLLANGSVDTKRLSGAVRCIVSNYRGTNVKNVPDSAIPSVLKRLGDAAFQAGKMPSQIPKPAATYCQLNDILLALS